MVDPRTEQEFPFVMNYMFLEDPNAFINFIENLVGATEMRERTVVDGTIVNACYKIANSYYEISQAREGFEQVCLSFHYYTMDMDQILTKAKEMNCVIKYQSQEMDYDDCESWFIDPFGNNWFVAEYIG